jgi:OOP family OmpA-OmpF porin
MQNKKRIVAATVVGLSSLVMLSNASAIESVNGLYLGAQGGWGNIHQQALDGDSATNADTGIAGRLFAGFKFNQNFALESGYTKFSNMNTSATSTTGLVTDSATATIKSYALDLVVKGILPLQNGLDLYGKIGGAYLNEVGNASETLSGPGFSITGTGQKTADAIYPTYGAGVSYTFNPNLTGDVSWMHIQKIGDNDFLGNTDFVGVGLTYNFG